MHFAQELVDDTAVGADLVIAGMLATGMADAGNRGAKGRAGAAEIEADLRVVQRIEGLLYVFRRAALEHDVAALPVQGDQAGAVLLPNVAHLAQHVGAVMHAGRGLDAQGVEFLGFGKVLGDLRKARDDAAAITEDADRAALPITQPGLVGMLQLTQKVVHHAGIRLVLVGGQPFQAGNEARPGAGLKLVEQRGRVFFLRHRVFLQELDSLVDPSFKSHVLERHGACEL